MPTYEYECKKCGHRFDEFQSILDRPVKKCPECKGTVKRLIGTGAGIIFKGKGFYQTDYKPAPTGGKKPEDKAVGTPPCGKSESCGSCN